MSDLVKRLAIAEENRLRRQESSTCEIGPGVMTEAAALIKFQAARIKALEAGLKPFAELKPVAWSLDADMFYIATNDIRHAASLLEKKGPDQ